MYSYSRFYGYDLLNKDSNKNNLPSINAKSFCVIDSRDGHILIGKNINKRLPNASTTKLLTALVVLDNCNLKDKVVVSKNAAIQPKVKLGMKEGSVFVLKDLLYSLLMCSHNDSAVALAEAVSGSVEDFSSLMNNELYNLKCFSSSFITPNGLDSEYHFSTAYDLCIIGAHAVNNSFIKSIINTPNKVILDENGKEYSLNNTNRFMSMDENNIGLKTGFTNKAGNCFVGARKINDTILISTVLGCGYPPNNSLKYTETTKMMDYIESNYRNIIIKYKDIKITNNYDNKTYIIPGGNIEILSNDNETVTEIVEIKGESINSYILYGNVKKQTL